MHLKRIERGERAHKEPINHIPNSMGIEDWQNQRLVIFNCNAELNLSINKLKVDFY
jgi:hypothetical protein